MDPHTAGHGHPRIRHLQVRAGARLARVNPSRDDARHRGESICAPGRFTAIPRAVMSALHRLFGRDTKFYDLLETSAEEASRSAAVLARLVGQVGTGTNEDILNDLAQARRRH